MVKTEDVMVKDGMPGEKQGPTAPEDPRKKGSGFYICRQKDIAGGPSPDGRGIQFIYLNDVRLLTFARMVGNVEDEEMLTLLKTTEGFRRMVEAVGVTIEGQDPDSEIDFALQMYGKSDPNHSGTTLRMTCKADSMERMLWLDEEEWSEDDDIPGQMRFEFPHAGQVARVDVMLYLREGFTAPPQEQCGAVDMESAEYREMLRKSLLQMGNNFRLRGMLERAQRGEDITIAFIGGSITQGAGAIPIHRECYAAKTMKKMREQFGGGGRMHFIKAGVGGTPSELGMIRFERDVLREGTVLPDLVVVEFAVNDEGDETKGVCYESLVRKILALSEKTAVILLFAVFADDFNLQERLAPIGERYQLPMVSIRDAVVEQFYRKEGEGRVLPKSRFFYDSYHPSNIGHTIMADCLLYLMEQMQDAARDETYSWQDGAPLLGNTFEEVRLIDRHTGMDGVMEVQQGSFTEQDQVLQAVEMDDSFTPTKQFPYNWQHRSGTEPFRMRLMCRALLLVSKDSGDIMEGRARVLVDGRQVMVVDPREVGWIHANARIIFALPESGEHMIEIAPMEGDEEKNFTILGFGMVP